MDTANPEPEPINHASASMEDLPFMTDSVQATPESRMGEIGEAMEDVQVDAGLAGPVQQREDVEQGAHNRNTNENHEDSFQSYLTAHERFQSSAGEEINTGTAWPLGPVTPSDEHQPPDSPITNDSNEMQFQGTENIATPQEQSFEDESQTQDVDRTFNTAATTLADESQRHTFPGSSHVIAALPQDEQGQESLGQLHGESQIVEADTCETRPNPDDANEVTSGHFDEEQEPDSVARDPEGQFEFNQVSEEQNHPTNDVPPVSEPANYSERPKELDIKGWLTNIDDWERVPIDGTEDETEIRKFRQNSRAYLNHSESPDRRAGASGSPEEGLQLHVAAFNRAHTDEEGDVLMSLEDPGGQVGGDESTRLSPQRRTGTPSARHRRVDELRGSTNHTDRRRSRMGKRKRTGNDNVERRGLMRSRTQTAAPSAREGCDRCDGDEHRLPLEMPKREYFDPNSPGKNLHSEHYVWGRPRSPPCPEHHPIPDHAPHPSQQVPNPMDDSMGLPGEMGGEPYEQRSRFFTRKRSKSSRPAARASNKKGTRGMRKNKHQSQQAQAKYDGTETENEDDVEEGNGDTDGDERMACTFNLPTLNGIPSEIREQIYRHLLVHEDPIHVYNGWKKVYMQTRQTRQNRQVQPTRLFSEPEVQSLYPAILRVCREFFWEGIRVLYGENRFLYRLRDPRVRTAPPPVDVGRLAHDDSATNDQTSEAAANDGDDSYNDDDQEQGEDPDFDPDWGEEEPARSATATRRSSRRRKQQAGMDGAIHIAKYFSLFRFIVVEAEQNRHSEDTMKCMADAVNTFVDPPQLEQDTIPICPATREPPAANIHTLTIKVHPKLSDITEEREPVYTFTGFFSETSPVIAAMRALLPQFIQIEVATKYLSEGSRSARMFIDMRPVRIHRRVVSNGADAWRGDRIIVWRRYNRARGAMRAVRTLAEEVHRCCQRYTPDLGDREGSDLMWDEYEDDNGYEGDF